MSQHSINDLESHNDLESQCSLLKSAQVYEQELAYGGAVKGTNKARKVALGAGALALVALVVFGGVFYFGEKAEGNASTSATANDSETASNNPTDAVELPVSDEHALVDGEAPDSSEGLACWQWGLIGTGAYVASNVLCAAFACSIFSCRVDSKVDYQFRKDNHLLTVAEKESRLKENNYQVPWLDNGSWSGKYYKDMSEEEKIAWREWYAKELVYEQAEFEESNKQAPGCCVLCQTMFECGTKAKDASEDEKAADRAEAKQELAELKQKEAELKQKGQNLNEKDAAKLEEMEAMNTPFCCFDFGDEEKVGMPTVCRGFVNTALWNFLTLNLCSIIPCIFPVNGPEDSCLFDDKGDPSCLTECYFCNCCSSADSSSQQEGSSMALLGGCCGGNEGEGEQNQ